MKTVKKIILFPLASLLLLLTGCAAGAATAGYAIKAQSADGLTTEAEQRIVDRVKREICSEGQSQIRYSNQI